MSNRHRQLQHDEHARRKRWRHFLERRHPCIEPPCHSKPKATWCDKNGPGGFMGHTCIDPPRQSLWRNFKQGYLNGLMFGKYHVQGYGRAFKVGAKLGCLRRWNRRRP